MTADVLDIAAVAPTLELTLDDPIRPASLHCVGVLDAKTSHYVLEAVEMMLRQAPATITVNVRRLRVADDEGGNTLAQIQRIVRATGVVLRWHGLGADHVRSAPELATRVEPRRRGADPRPVPLPAAWLPSPGFPWHSPQDPAAA